MFAEHSELQTWVFDWCPCGVRNGHSSRPHITLTKGDVSSLYFFYEKTFPELTSEFNCLYISLVKIGSNIHSEVVTLRT